MAWRTAAPGGPLCFLLLTIAGCHIAGCNTVLNPFPGGAINQAEAQVVDWAFARDKAILRLETNAASPYSVNVRYVYFRDAPHIDGASRRRWHDNIRQDPAVRVLIDGKLVRAALVEVGYAVPGLLGERSRYRLELKGGN